MFLTQWCRRFGRPVGYTGRRARGPAAGVRLWPDRLDDRLTPSGGGWANWIDNVASAPATHLLVVGPESTSAGSPAPFEVVALDASNHLAASYTGTVHLTSSDTGATLPADYTFTAGDHGVHVLDATLATPGSQTVTATATATATITGSAGVTVTAAPAPATVTHFAVLARPAAYAGAPEQLLVVALDASDHPVSGYTGTVHFTSTDAAATLPADYTFTAQDRGRHTFTATLNTAGSQTVTVADTTAGSTATGSATVTVTQAPVATHFLVLTEPQAYAGSPDRVAVVALDAANHIVPTYTGTVHLTDTDAKTTLPADYTFTAADAGVHVFDLTPGATGTETVTATDTATATTTGSVTLTVAAAPVATHLAVVAWPRAVAGAPQEFAVVALDDSNHIVPTYTGTVHITSTDTKATLPADYTFTATDAGVHLFQATFATAGKDSVTATDTGTASVTGTVTVSVGANGPGDGGSPFGFRHRWW